jgi:DNA mismatch repair ATPase MutL
MMGVKMVGAEHTSEPHPIIYDTIGESLPDGSTTSSRTVTEEEQQEQQQEQQQQQDNQQQQQQEDNNQQQQQQQQDTTPPAAPTNLSIATGQADNTPTVTGNAEANSTVKLFSQSTLLGSTTTSAGGSFSVTVSSPLSDGTYTFTLTATDAANNVSNSSGITFIINTNAGGGNQGGGGGYGYGS